jgi:drug/metabolite transporter (DMT)-like permease
VNASTRSALLGACFLWAISFVATKIALEVVPPLTVVSLRLLIAAACFLPILLTGGRWRTIANRATLLKLFGLSLFGAGLHYGFQTVGLQTTNASNASVYVATGPITILLLAVIFLGEKLSARKILGIAIAIAGVLVVMGMDTITGFELDGNLMGDLLVFVSIVMWGCFTVFGKKVTDELGALTVTAAVTLIGATWMTPVGWLEMQRAGFSLVDLTPTAWAAVAYLGFACNFLAVLLYFTALQRTESQKVGVYLYAIPPMTAVAAALVLSEPITLGLVVGTVLVIAGVALTERG